MLSKFSSDRPIGSLWVWQEAQTGLVAWASRRWRTVRKVGLWVSLTMSKFTLAGGAGVGWHMKMSFSATPRLVGEERPGCENMARKVTWVSTPLRPDSCGNSYGTQSASKL